MELPVSKVEATGKAKASLILLHTLGDTAQQWDFFPQFLKQAAPDILESVNLVLPSSLSIRSSEFQVELPAWFDLHSDAITQESYKADLKGLFFSIRLLQKVIDDEVSTGVPAEKIIIAGFGQGAVMAMILLGLLDIKVGGFIALSGGFAYKKELLPLVKKVNSDTPVLQCHGTADPLYPIKIAEESYELLKTELGLTNSKFIKYENLAHLTFLPELFDMLEFIQSIVN